MEKFIIGESSTKKTRRMLEHAKESNSIVVCKNVLSMQNKANSYGIYGLKFMSYEEFNEVGVDDKKIAIDEIGDFFEYCYGTELDAFTMTID